MDIWTWFGTTFPAGAVTSGATVGAFVAAILTDRLFTRGQHLRIVNDLKAHHARERESDAARIAEMKESREGYKEAARVERERADRGADAMREVAPTLRDVQHVLESLDRALPGGGAS